MKNYSALALPFGPRFKLTTRRPDNLSISSLKTLISKCHPLISAPLNIRQNLLIKFIAKECPICIRSIGWCLTQ